MFAHADDHFTCTAQSYVNCCSDCEEGGCTLGCDGSCGKGESGERNKTVSCPTKRPDESLGSRSGLTVYWHLDDEDGFLSDLANDYGIDPSWITYDAQPVSLREGCKVDDYCGSWWFNYPT